MVVKKKNQKGAAIIELIPVLVVIAIIVNFMLGFWGVIHSGILNSIGARNYAFETFRNRSHLNRLRDAPDSDATVEYEPLGFRFHGIIQEGAPNVTEWYVTQRPIRFSESNFSLDVTDDLNDHRRVFDIQEGQSTKNVYNDGQGITRVWLRTIYGICLNATCRGP